MEDFIFESWKGNEKQIEAIEKEVFPLDFWTLQNISESVEFPLFFGEVCKTLAGETVGYYGMNIIAGEGYIANIAVAKNFQGGGFGNVLIKRLIGMAMEKNCDEITLEVRVSNEKAIKLYQKFGFEIAAERKGFYCDGENAYIMWKK